MSFFGEAAKRCLDIVHANTPAWKDTLRWTSQSGLANLPTVNIGPWWRDYHRSLERLHTGYARSMSCPSLGDVCSRTARPLPDRRFFGRQLELGAVRHGAALLERMPSTTAFQTQAKVLPLPDLNVADRQSERTDASGSAASRACESEPKFEEQVWP